MQTTNNPFEPLAKALNKAIIDLDSLIDPNTPYESLLAQDKQVLQDMSYAVVEALADQYGMDIPFLLSLLEKERGNAASI